MPWTVRPATDFDPDAIERFTSQAWQAHHSEQNHDLSYDWESQHVHLIASGEGQRIVGVAKGRIRAGVGHLSELIVDRAVRGQGIGTRLIEAFEERCHSAGCHKLTVVTELHGPAEAFYRHRGWRVEGIFERDRGGLDFVRLKKFVTGQPAGASGKGNTG